MLHYLLPWMNNVELVDLKPARRAEEVSSAEEEEEEQDVVMVNSRRWLRGEGWGSPRATTMVLNNLMFMTAKVSAARRQTTHTFILITVNSYRRTRFFKYFFIDCMTALQLSLSFATT